MASSSGAPMNYVDWDEEIEVDQLDWEGGSWEGEEEPPEEPEEPSGSPEEHWREMLQTTAARISYVNRILGLHRGDPTYSSALRYIRLIADGQREPESERWVNVRRAAEIDYELAHKHIPPPPRGGASRGPGTFRRGDYLTGAMSFQMDRERDRRNISGTLTLDKESLRLANDGQLVKAFLQGYFDGQMF